MFRKHVKRRLSAYCNGELADEESRRVAEHLLACQRCRKEYERVNLGVRFARQLTKVTAPDEIWSGVDEMLDSAALDPSKAEYEQRGLNSGRAKPRWAVPRLRGWQLGAVAACLALLCVVGLLIYVRQESKSSWTIASVEGNPKIGSHVVHKDSRLYAGELLETDQSSRATLYPGPIGEVAVEPGSRVRVLKAAQENEYRLSLERGEVQAKVTAPPRLFFVDTPSAEAVDLGCAYTLDVDDTGAGLLVVTGGWVELVGKGRYKSKVPSEAACMTRPGIGPGTPFFVDASRALKEALGQLDFGGRGGAQPLETVLAEARKRDSLTLWHLLFRAGLPERSRVYERLAELVPPPEGTTRDGIMRLDQAMLDEWFLEIQPAWFQ